MSAINPGECKEALLAGGTSREREISIASGEGAKKALEEAEGDLFRRGLERYCHG